MKLRNKNKGTGSVIALDGSTRYLFPPDRFLTVPDEVGERLLAKYSRYLEAAGDSPTETKAAVASVSASHAKVLAAKDAEIAQLKDEVKRLQNLVALTPPVPDTAPASESAEEAPAAAAPRRGRRSNAEIAAEKAAAANQE